MSGRSSKLDQVLEKALTKSLEHLDEQKFYSYFSFCDAPSCQRLRNALIGNITTAVKVFNIILLCLPTRMNTIPLCQKGD